MTLSTTFIHAAMITIPHNTEYYISYGYTRAIDNDANTVYQTLGECYQSNAAVTVYLKNSSGVSIKSAAAYRG